jgi:hypothetical protein
MKTIELMLRHHPHADEQKVVLYPEAVGALATCTSTCTASADACLGEPGHAEHLRRCIRCNLDCADGCVATTRLLTRQTETPNEIVHAQLHACVVASQACAEECEHHREPLDYCRICAEACRHRQERCNSLLGEISSSGTAAGFDPDETSTLAR